MSFLNVTAGDDAPKKFNVIIEIAANGQPVKYELDKETGLLSVDRFMPTAMHYPANYGYIPSTLSDDGDPADVLVLTPQPIQPGCVVVCRALGMLSMTDESGEDNKILAVPVEKVCAEYANIHSLNDLSPIILERISHFFSSYKALEPNKWVKIGDWKDAEAAQQEVTSSISNYQAEAMGG